MRSLPAGNSNPTIDFALVWLFEKKISRTRVKEALLGWEAAHNRL
jgi:hypothetical protein